jgi:hypothetical protein
LNWLPGRFVFRHSSATLLAGSLLLSAILLSFPALVRAEEPSPPPSIELGFRQMYNLQFERAHETFHQWQLQHPEDPTAFTADAAAYLFSEFDRLGILQTELFLEDGHFWSASTSSPSPEARRLFDAALSRSDVLADRVLAEAPQNSAALFAKVLNLGLKGDYLALIEKHKVRSLGYMKEARMLAEQLLDKDPTYYDAYLAIGVENYILGLTPAPVRWMLRLYGAQTDKAEGINQVRLTAEKGRYLLPYARLLLAVAALRDKDTIKAREILQGLAREFPKNTLYSKELAKLE